MRQALLASVALHFLIAGWHGATHQLVPVPLSPLQMAFVGLVIVALPVAGGVLVLRGRLVDGALLVAATMFASLLFGIVNHFVLISPDNVRCIEPGPWRLNFIGSAVLVALSEVAGTLIGALAFWRWSRPGARPA